MTRILRPAAVRRRARDLARDAAFAAILSARRGAPAGPRRRPKLPPEKSRATEAPGAMIDRANHFLMQERCAEAIPILERLTTEYPRIAAANEMLAGCYIKEGRAQDAASLLERCLEEEPGQFAYVRDLGRAYMDLGRREDAVAVWRSLLAGDEKTAAMYGHVAKMEQEAGLYDEAIETLRAGAGFKETSEYYSREIIRLERIIGREEDAFRDALLLIGQRQGALEGEIRERLRHLQRIEETRTPRRSSRLDDRGGKRQERHIPHAQDDLSRRGGALRRRAKAPVRRGRPGVPRGRALRASPPPGEKAARSSGDGRFASLRDDLMRLFLERFGSSTLRRTSG